MTTPPLTLKDTLKEWADQDGAMFELARCLGVIPSDADFIGTKGLWWSNNPTGNLMHEMLQSLTKLGALEFRVAPSDDQFRWNPNWEIP